MLQKNLEQKTKKQKLKKISNGKSLLFVHRRSTQIKEKEPNTKTKSPVEGSVDAPLAEKERLHMENAYLKKLNSLVQIQDVI